MYVPSHSNFYKGFLWVTLVGYKYNLQQFVTGADQPRAGLLSTGATSADQEVLR